MRIVRYIEYITKTDNVYQANEWEYLDRGKVRMIFTNYPFMGQYYTKTVKQSRTKIRYCVKCNRFEKAIINLFKRKGSGK